MSVKLKNAAFPIIIDRTPDTAINFEDVVVQYKKSNAAGDMLTANIDFSELVTGSYIGEMALPDAGTYALNVVVPTVMPDGAVNNQNITTTVVVANSSIDLVQNSINAAVVKIDSIKSQVDLLDEDSLNTLKGATDSITTQLTSITELINDENNDGIVSLKELLKQLADATDGNKALLSAIQGYVTAATDDIEHILRGSDKLADGTDNPFKGNTNIDIMNQVEAVGTAIKSQLDSVKAIITDAITAAKNELLTAVAGARGVVEANKDLLSHADFGLAQIKTVIDGLKAGNTDSLRDIQTDVTTVITNLSAFKNELVSKIDAVKGDTESIKTKLDNSNKIAVIL